MKMAAKTTRVVLALAMLVGAVVVGSLSLWLSQGNEAREFDALKEKGVISTVRIDLVEIGLLLSQLQPVEWTGVAV